MFWTGELIARTAPVRRRVAPPPWASPLAGKARAAYLGMAIGDALGASVEFMTPKEIQHQYGAHCEITGGGWLRLKAGQVTDDTTMALALGKAILSAGHVDALAAATAFDNWMRGKPVDIGNTVRRNLIQFRKTGHPEAQPSEHDAGNGAAMRVLPVALATYGQPAEQVIAASRAQAHVTHHNALSDACCETLIFMVQDFLAGQTADQVRSQRVVPLIEQFPIYAYDRKRSENPSGYVVDTLHAVLQGFFATDNFEDCLVDVVNRGGDADTTGAIVGLLAGAYYGYDAIPKRWLRALDEITRLQCEKQAEALIELSRGKPAQPADQTP
ncbi:MAG: ADP-ribosylation/Crystallin [Proteobacteria bacterium]|nr:ADP-ribosylation/Crystallin [Pseudomonadota bacterium]